MTSFKILAQSYTTTQRITKTISAASWASVMRSVSAELDAAGYYVVSVARV